MWFDPFVDQLGELCATHRTRAKWVVVGSHAIGRALGERLALEGVSWANLRFVTPLGLALDTAAPFLVDQDLAPVPDELGPALVMGLLLAMPDGPDGYFRPMADQPRMGEALRGAICELRLAGVAAAHLPASAFEDARKHRELRELLDAYEQRLFARRQADAADVYRVAAANASHSPVGAGDAVLELPAIAPLLVRRFLDALPGEHIPSAIPSVPGLAQPRRFDSSRHDARPAASRLACLLAPERAPAREGAAGITMFHAAGREAEIEGVLRRILTPGGSRNPVPLDQVEVACASSSAAALLWEKGQRLDLPLTIEHGVPVAGTRPARALLGLCDWIASDFVAGRLRHLFQSGDVTIAFPDGGAAGQAARLLMRSEASWGRETYAQSLTAMAERDERFAADAAEDREEEERAEARARAGRARYLAAWIDQLLELIPLPDEDGSVPLQTMVSGLRAFLDERVAVAGALDGGARAALLRSLGELLQLGPLQRPASQVLALVRDAAGRLTVGASRARPGHLHIASLHSAGYAGRPLTFLVGLEEGGVFPARVEDAVLLDDERRRLSEGLPTSGDRLGEAVHRLMTRLAVLPTPSVCFSYSCRDLRDGRETFPSWLMLRALRLMEGDPQLSFDDLRKRLGPAETLAATAPEQALTDAGWWVSSLRAGAGDGLNSVLEAFPSLARGRAAMDARDSTRFTEWDGLVREARALLDPRVSGRPISATRLERLVGCPFRYFVEHGLGVEVPGDGDPDRDEWLDALQRGSALHGVYATLGREARERGARLQPRRDGIRAREVADAALQELRALIPPPSDVVFDRERAEFLRDVELFLEFEANRGESEPIAFEVPFGHGADSGEPLAQGEPVRIRLGGGQSFLLRGTIDRIDRLPDGSYEVIDYKTGRYEPDKWRGTFRGSAMLQHALYGMAAAQLLRRIEARPTIARGVYEFPSAKGGGERVTIAPPPSGTIAAVLSDLFDVIAEGAFVSADDENQCRYCDFSRACGMPVEQAKGKIAETDNTGLSAYRRLRDHD